MSIDNVTLERFKLAMITYISGELIDDFAIAPKVDVSGLVDIFANDVCVRIVQAVYGETLERIEYPSDWRQAFKVRWFPAWALKRWPAKMTVYEIRAFYPKVSLPDMPNTVQFSKMTGGYD